ncbi:discoidin domain-containing protein [Verrucomicrobium sp. BvORR106]|uniref:DUF7133 domain-containing protein n=1 Tax=Verrucomicrobium sp. BvORR106 TaxID=1403819 RepID=UPI00056DC0CE|nr:discoidin domain-containing protein [Verrucomicrobium sp. BvORR106]
MRRLLFLIPLALAAVSSYHMLPAQSGDAKSKPLKALLIAGGCCHDYAKQQEILSKGIQSRANVQVDVIWTDDKSTTPPLPLYDNADWAKGYDIIIHDECAAGSKDPAVLQRVLDAHKTIPAVHLHCAMHSFRTGSDAWFKHLGLQSTGHGPQEPVAIRYVDSEHPITKPLQDWTTIKEELYNNVNIFDAHPLAMGKQSIKQKDGSVKDVEYIVAWTNEKSGAKSFSTTIGHNNDTVADARYLDLLTRGVLWAAGKLDPAYLVPYTGENKVTFVKANPPAPKAEAPAPAAPPAAAKDATQVKVTASSEETGKSNFAWKAVDGSKDSRWCANGGDRPQWLQLEFDKPQNLSGAKIVWESNAPIYPHKLETSADGKSWTVVADTTKDPKGGDTEHSFIAKDAKYVKLTVEGKASTGWVSVREISLKGDGIKSIAAKVDAKDKAQAKKEDEKNSSEFAKEGNITPKIVKLTAEQEAEVLKDVKVPDGFEATVFASPPAVNYPVYVAAAPDGTLYVSSDGNGSLGRNPKRGRIIRLKDVDGDGRADEVKEFVKDVDSPRGLVWDHDRLYLVHPPHLSVFIDKDGDGVSDEQKVLVKNLAFGFADRPADHTTNGLSLGVDGWLYIAGGDFGFMQAEGTDGRKVQHRGGGVIRVRPDGTGLEIYSTGTRNILEVAVSPTMDIFARDNTNDGGGWNVRFHHFTGLENHGYPRLYKNFADEAITPLADYGGGSGCGAVYIDEPGFGKWSNAPFTADWGTGALWHHTVKVKGSTYEETAAPQPFIKMTRPTDADVDANSNVYCASWKGATFNWEGPNVGYVVRVKPKDFKAAPLPNYAKAANAELVKELSSPSYRRRIEAERELVRRKATKEVAIDLAGTFRNKDLSPAARIAAIYTMRLGAKDPSDFVVSLASPETEADWQVVANAYRAELHESVMPFGTVNVAASTKTTSIYEDSRLSVQMARTLLSLSDKAPRGPLNIARFLNAKQDEVARHVAIRALGMSGASKDLFGIIDANPTDSSVEKVIDDTARKGALRALAMIHKPEVVDGLIARLDKANDPALRKGIFSALARLHFTEGEWKGDSWGTRPDTRGPYYQPEAWGESPKVAAALKEALAKASAEDAAYLVSELNRNRIQFNEALERILTLAAKDSKLLPDAVGQLANAETIPAAGIPLLISAASSNPPASPTVLSQAIVALTKTDSADGVKASLGALVALNGMKDAGKEQETARNAFLNSAKLENHHQLLELEAEKLGTPAALWADAALLNLSARKTGSPESRELSGKALDQGWQNPQRRVQILKAVAMLKHNPYADKVIAALDDSDKAVAAAATNAAKAMKLEKKTKESGPLISTLQQADVIAQVLKTKGDAELGEQLFTRQTCVACHTTREDEPQKGPYLGNIAQTYKREELAMAILDPNKTIAQGFATEMFALKDGTQQLGFVTLESADQVKIRTITSQEFTYKVADIAKREKLPISMMPPGLVMNLTVKEFASLLDYLQALSKK